MNRCGTLGGSDHSKREVKNTKPTKNYMWNTVTIQYNPLIEEEWDEHFKVSNQSSAALRINLRRNKKLICRSPASTAMTSGRRSLSLF